MTYFALSGTQNPNSKSIVTAIIDQP